MLQASSKSFIAYFVTAYPGRTALMIVLIILAGVVEGVGVVLLFPLLNHVVGSGSESSALVHSAAEILQAVNLESSVGSLLAVIVAIMFAKALIMWQAKRQVGYTVAQVATDLRLRLLRAMMAADWRFFISQSTGEFANAIGTEARRASFAYQSACAVMAGIIQVGVYFVVALLASWILALFALGTGALLVLLMSGFVRMTRIAGREQTEVMRSMLGRLTELLPGIKPIKAMAREGGFSVLLECEAREYNEAERRRILALEFTRSFREPIFVLVMAAGLYLALVPGSMAVATVSLLAILFYRILFTLGEMQTHFQEMTLGESAFQSLQSRVELAEAMRETKHGQAVLPRFEREIRLEKVTHIYQGSSAVLKDVSMNIQARSFVSITGPSGAGKTTLVDLVGGLLRPSSGRILVDGVPLDQIDCRGWNSLIGYVPQKTLLFNTSIQHNVTLGEERISKADVRWALEIAGAWTFVSAFKNGVDHVVGEHGTRLSGGQGQRIMLARALVKRPRLLILDEATSALDPDTVAAVCSALRRLSGSMTIIAVSHQPSMLAAADSILHLSVRGRIGQADVLAVQAGT